MVRTVLGIQLYTCNTLLYTVHVHALYLAEKQIQKATVHVNVRTVSLLYTITYTGAYQHVVQVHRVGDGSSAVPIHLRHTSQEPVLCSQVQYIIYYTPRGDKPIVEPLVLLCQ